MASCPTCPSWQTGIRSSFPLDAPVLVVPLADGLAQDGDNSQHIGPLSDRARIAQGLILDCTGQGGAAVKSLVLASWPSPGNTPLSSVCTSTVTVLMYSWQCAR